MRVLTFLIALWLSGHCLSLNAQLKEFDIDERDPDGSQDVQTSSEYLDNAIVLVYSDLDGLDFRSSVGGINQQTYNERAGRYEILVSPQLQILFVAAPGFIEQRVSLINPEPNSVFYYHIKQSRGEDEADVIFSVVPNDAKLLVNGVPTKINSEVYVPKGMAKIRLEREGFATIVDSIEISSVQANYRYSMEKVVVEPVKIRTNVSDVKVEIDGKEKGVTDRNGAFDDFLYPGTYNIRLSKLGYLTQEQSIVVQSKEENKLVINLPTNRGMLVLKSAQSGVRILVNGQEQSKNRLDVIVGRYLIEASKEGYEDFQKYVNVKRNKVTEVNVQLELKKGELQFRVTPFDAEVKLQNEDGKVVEKWTGIKFLPDLPIGNYVVEVKASGYPKRKTFLQIKHNETTEILLDMSDEQDNEDAKKIKKLRPYSLLLSCLPRENENGISYTNSNYGIHFNYVPKNVGFYTEAATSTNFSTTNLVFQDDAVVNSTSINGSPVSGSFLPHSNIQSWEAGGGLVFRKGVFSLMLGANYFVHHFRQEFDVGSTQPELVFFEDKSFEGIIPKAGLQLNIKGFALGYAVSTYHRGEIANVIMLGISF